MADLTTLAKVRGYMRGEFATASYTMHDAELTRLIAVVSADVRSRTDRALDYPAASHTDRFDGDGSQRVHLRNVPVATLTSVTVDGSPVPLQTVSTGDGYYLDGNEVQLVGYTFTAGIGNCSIAYTAGAALVPADLEQAVIQLVALAFTDGDHIGQSQKTINGDNVTWNGGPQLVNAQAIIDRYTRTPIA